MKKRVLITGGSGLLALNWAYAARSRASIILGLHRRDVSLSWCENQFIELESICKLARVFERLAVDVVVHTAALTNVEKCEHNALLSNHVNVTLAENVAKACALAAVDLVHISTDHLFDGKIPLVDETEPVRPLNVYAKTKAIAEIRVLSALPRALVIRTNFYGWGPRYRWSFSDHIINALSQNSDITLFEDIYYTPILAETLVTATHDLLDMNIFGVFNISGDERLSKYDFARKIASAFSLNFAHVKPARLPKTGGLLRRPPDMSLSNKKVCALLGKKLGFAEAQIARLRSQESDAFIQEIRSQ